MKDKTAYDQFPLGFKLRLELRGHMQIITRIVWSPDGTMLTSPSEDGTISLWDTQTGKIMATFLGHSRSVLSTAWSPDGKILASASDDQTIRLWDVSMRQPIGILKGHSAAVNSIAWSPDGKILASASGDQTIRLWDASTKKLMSILEGHIATVIDIKWSPDGKILASASGDQTIRLWERQTGRTLGILKKYTHAVMSIAWSHDGKLLASSSYDDTISIWDTKTAKLLRMIEGHTDWVTCIAFSYDDGLLASKSRDGTVRLWRTDSWDTVAVLQEPSSGNWTPGLAFHPSAPILATLGQEDTVIRIWELDTISLKKSAQIIPTSNYKNAKVVLVGDSGVGKSGLALVLTDHPYAPTESTHSRHIWTFESSEILLENGRRENREILLWDLAGQPGYRLIHQLHLNEVTVALVVIDPSSETDPFSGVYHWDRALRQAQSLEGISSAPIKKFLVAARMDRYGIRVSHSRVERLVQELNFSGYFETSAKEGWGIAKLAQCIKENIDWSALPRRESDILFKRFKAFLVAQKEAGHLLSTIDDLYRAFPKPVLPSIEGESLYAHFESAIGLVEAAGLIRRLSFGRLVLLQPELLDFYASALVNAIRDEPDGLGSIFERKVQAGNFRIPYDGRIADKEQERLLLFAMIEDMLRYELAWREQGYLVFPSLSTREKPFFFDLERPAVIFRFEGPLQNVYATLAVRLSHSGVFTKKDLWKNAVTYTTKDGGTYGIVLKDVEEGHAELGLFFDESANEIARALFEQYVRTHLQRRALPGSVSRQRIVACPVCETVFSDLQIERRKERGFTTIRCSVCDTDVSLIGDEEEQLRVSSQSIVSAMNQAADTQRELEARPAVARGELYELVESMRHSEVHLDHIDVLLLTVTEVETKAVCNLFSNIEERLIGDKIYYDFGMIKDTRVCLMQLEMGIAGSSSASLRLQEGIRSLNPSAVVMVGIAFGINSKRQRIGDILVSNQILDCKPQQSSGGSPVSNGDKASTSPKMLDRFIAGVRNWRKPPNVEFGLLLSGTKLVNEQEFKDPLLSVALEAIGCDTEGTGLFTRILDKKVDWILVKAICDWTYSHKSQNSKSRQRLAAENAARFTFHVISQGGFSKPAQAVTQRTPGVQATTESASVAPAVLEHKMAISDFDVFLCYNSVDKAEVKKIGLALKARGILPWLDEWELLPGQPWQRVLESQIKQIKSAAVFVGKDAIGPWQQMELEAFLREFVKRGSPVIPVLLPDAPQAPQLPIFLKGMTWVDFRKHDSDPIERLTWGVTGKRDMHR